MDRRMFLKLTGLAAGAAGALEMVPAAVPMSVARSPQRLPTDGALQAPGLYQISGRVRLDEPTVWIGGITNAQQITWSGLAGAAPPVTSFSSFETFDRPWRLPAIQVRGGTLEAVSVVPVNLV